MNKVMLFDAGSENFIREALGLDVRNGLDNEKCAFGYVKECGGVKELTSYGELFELEIEE
jgi:hypothetical protein